MKRGQSFANSNDYWKNFRKGLSIKAGIVAGLGAGIITDNVEAANCILANKKLKQAYVALNQGQIARAHKLLTSETSNSIYLDLLEELSTAQPALTLKKYVDGLFSRMQNGCFNLLTP